MDYDDTEYQIPGYNLVGENADIKITNKCDKDKKNI